MWYRPKTETKHQSPITKHQRISNNQAPTSIVIWCFSGAWLLVIGYSSLAHELHFRNSRNQSALLRQAEESSDRFAAFLSIIQRPMIHIHSHESVGQILAHPARVLQRVLYRFATMIE